MSIASELTRIQTAKADIKTAIEAKGVTVPSSATIDTYDDYITSIPSGGSGSDETLKGLIERSGSEFIIPSGVTTIGRNICREYYSITSVTIPDSVTSIGLAAFQTCTSLTSITIPNSVTSIAPYAFDGCSKLMSINIPNGITIIDVASLKACSSLTNISIPSSVTVINNEAFYQCTGLTGITIPSSVTRINNTAFRYCTGLASITCLSTVPPTLGSNVFNNTNDCPIYVPSGSVETYKSANNWSTYASRIQAIPNS